MLRIPMKHLEAVKNVKTAADLRQHLQAALQVEHAGIPPYLTAMFSIRRGTNAEIQNILGGIVLDEMLHMAIVANVLNAVGGKPTLNSPEFVPEYPGRLPLDIQAHLEIGLKRLSMPLVRDVFMEIEEPEGPEDFPVRRSEAATVLPPFATIGQFYQAMIHKIRELGEGIFTGNPDRQFIDPVSFPERDLFAINGVESATRALRIIIDQGEGSPRQPISPDGEVAHYYRLAQIVHGRALVRTQDPPGYAYAGDQILLDSANIIDLVENSKASQYAVGSVARRKVDDFNRAYTEMLHMLHETFNGAAGRINDAIELMLRLTGLAREITEIDVGGGRRAAPSFEYVAELFSPPLHGPATRD